MSFKIFKKLKTKIFKSHTDANADLVQSESSETKEHKKKDMKPRESRGYYQAAHYLSLK